MEKVDEKYERREIISMFPTLVWQTTIGKEFHQALNRNIINKLNVLRQTTPHIDSHISWQSTTDLHCLEEFQTLISLIEDTVSGILLFLKIGYDDFEITGCWANMNAAGGTHNIHSHPNNFLSGVYYVQTAEGSDTINFHDPRIQAGIIRPPVTELSGENTDQVVVRVEEGMFLIFPSWLQHSVDANQSSQLRISISFNIMFSPYVETMSKPLW